jgi:hypothetical protein
MKHFFNTFVLFFFILPTFSFANEEVFSLKKTVPINMQEYFAEARPGSVMMKVNIMGSVNKPGVYNVPVNSELSSVLTFAGGPSIDANIEEVMIRSKHGEKTKIKRVDLVKFFKDSSENPYILKPNDYVYLQPREKLISNDVLQTTILVSTILSIVVAMVIIENRFSK